MDLPVGMKSALGSGEPADNSEATVNTVHFYPGYTNKYESMGTAVAGIDIPAAGMSGLVTVLGDNYPNPFTLETTIPFAIGEKSQVELTIYDVLGRRITTLVNALLLPDSYTISWNGTNDNHERVKPGIYICKLKAGRKVMVKSIEMIE